MSDAEQAAPPGGQALTNFRLASIEAKIDNLSSNYVPVGIYNLNQTNTSEYLKRVEKALSDETTERQVSVTAVAASVELLKTSIQANKDDLAKSRKQFWTSVAVGGLLLVIGIFINPIAHALGLA